MSDVLVYLIRVGDAVKIGSSTQPVKRLKELATGCPEPPVLLAVFSGGVQFERQLQRHFASKHRHLEWFTLTDEDCDSVAEMSPSGKLDTPSVTWKRRGRVRERAVEMRRYQSGLRGVSRRFRTEQPQLYRQWLKEALAEIDAGL